MLGAANAPQGSRGSAPRGRGDTAHGAGQSCRAQAWGASKPWSPANLAAGQMMHCRHHSNVWGKINNSLLSSPKFQADFLEKGHKAVWPALLSLSLSRVALIHLIDLEVGFMK